MYTFYKGTPECCKFVICSTPGNLAASGKKRRFRVMGYVDEVIERVITKNPGEPEFHQAVKEVLESLRPVVDANEALYRKEAILERITEPDRQIKFRVPWVDDKEMYRLIQAIVYSSTMQSDRTREAYVFIRQ